MLLSPSSYQERGQGEVHSQKSILLQKVDSDHFFRLFDKERRTDYNARWIMV